MERTQHASAVAAPPNALRWVAVLSALFWVHYFLVHDVFGMLTADEIYFAHVFWLMANGLEPYSDFFSAHLPAYFHVMGLLVPANPGSDLSFVWALRLTNLAVGGAYGWLLYRLCPREFLFLLPFLFMFIPLARMAEIRPDTIGLLLMNIGWWSLLQGTARRNMLLAAAMALLSLLFSARAAIIAVGIGLVLLYLCYRRKDYRTVWLLLATAVVFLAMVGSFYAADPARFVLMIRSAYFTAVPYLPPVPLWQRIVPLDRLLLVLLIAAAFIASLVRLRRGYEQRALVIAGASMIQLVLILADPSPYQYVYGWAALPVLAGLALPVRDVGRRAVTGLAAASAAVTGLLFSAALIPLLSGVTPRPGSFVRITYDAPIAGGALQAMPLEDLLKMLVSTDRQEGLWNQLALYSEICRRVDEPVLTRFYANPICLPDLRYDWPGLKWPDMLADGAALSPRASFEQLIAAKQPRFVAWGRQHYRPSVSPWGRALLRDYDIHDGFALRRVAVAGDGSASRRDGGATFRFENP